jgi:hypothetical protein
VQLTVLLRFEVLMVVKMLMLVFWIKVMWTCRQIPVFQRNIFRAEVGIYLQVHMVLLCRRPTWTSGLLFAINVYIPLFAFIILLTVFLYYVLCFILGLPNVGKSSIINSLKRSRACNVGATPGVTK